MECIQLAQMSVIWDGKQMDWFRRGRGIRQGDAMSPAIFVLCIERLSHMICDAVNKGQRRGIRLSR